MKRISILFTFLSLITLSCFSQINRYDNPSRATYTPLSIEEIQAPARMMRQRYDNNAAKINALIDWTFELKKNKTDAEFQRKIDDYYKTLRSYLDNNLDLARMDNQIKQVEYGIKEEIDAYNKRVDTANNAYNSNNDRPNYNENYYIQKGIKDFNCRNHMDAFSNFKRAIELNPYNPLSYFYIGILEGYRENFSNAIDNFRMCLKLDPKNTDALYERATIKSRLGDNLGAISDCDLILKFNQERPIGYGRNLADVYNQIAWYYFMDKKFLNCVEFANKAIKVNPLHYNAIDSRGCGYYELGYFEKCISDMSKAIEINPESKNSYFYRGLAYIKINKIDLARKDFSKAGELGEEKAYEAIKTYCK
jgi:tetratricopeptide (TPR) repeat protein